MKVKGLMRKAEARTREALVEAMGRALDAVTVRDVFPTPLGLPVESCSHDPQPPYVAKHSF